MPTVAEALQIGWQRHQAGDVRGGEQVYLQVLQVDPQNANAWCFLGMARHDLGRFSEAETAYLEALRVQPNFPIALSNLANTLKSLGRLDEAIARCHESLQLKPDYVTAYNNLGVTLVARGDFGDAIVQFRKAVSLQPQNPLSNANLGAALIRVNELEEGEMYSRAAIRFDPQFAEAHKTLAILDLLNGNYERGFQAYEWRWKCPAQRLPNFPHPQWEGEPLNGRTLLLCFEQGLGDTLHFIRYAKIAKQMGGRVAVVCQKPLIPLLRTCEGIDDLAAEGEVLPPFDCYLPLLSVPRVLKTTLSNVPADVPYLAANPGLIDAWRKKLKPYDGFRIGIAWQGSPNYHADGQRSFPLAEFEPLASIPNVRLFSLQKGLGSEQVAAFQKRFPLIEFGDDLDREAGPFMDTAAILKNLDLVISADTSLGHLAAGMNVPTWLAMCAAPDWRWMFHREDSPWYPSVRLFRQDRVGEWKPVFRRMADELTERLVSSRGGRR